MQLPLLQTNVQNELNFLDLQDPVKNHGLMAKYDQNFPNFSLDRNLIKTYQYFMCSLVLFYCVKICLIIYYISLHVYMDNRDVLLWVKFKTWCAIGHACLVSLTNWPSPWPYLTQLVRYKTDLPLLLVGKIWWALKQMWWPWFGLNIIVPKIGPTQSLGRYSWGYLIHIICHLT